MFLDPTSPPPPSRATRLAIAALCLIWLLAGSLGHDPWKFDDALHLGIAYGLGGDNWWLPRLAGEPWLHNPPLYYWLAALAGKLFGGLLPWHDAARLASVGLGGIALFALYGTALRLAGAIPALLAPILALGTLGLVIPIHEAQPALAGFAGFALALYGLAVVPQQALLGGLWLGLGIGLAFLGNGLDGAAPPVVTAVLAAAHPHWRTRKTLLAWLGAVCVAAALALPWPLWLQTEAPHYALTWWANELVRLMPRNTLGWNHLELLGWAAWPLWPLALWLLWRERKRLAAPVTALPLLGVGAGLLLFLSDDARTPALLPLLAPLAVLAARGIEPLRRGAANAFDWFGMMTFSLLAGLLWLGGIAILTGEPARVAKNFSKPAPGFIADFSVPAVVLAIGVTVGWLVAMTRMPRTPWRTALRWSCGAATAWLLLCSLWLPWIDYGKSYRSAALALRAELPPGETGCIERRGLGAAQRASLDYFAGIRTVSRGKAQNCAYLLVQTAPKAETEIAGWRLVIEVARPGDKAERLRLYRR